MDEIEMKARKILFELGMPEHIKGYEYVVSAISYAVSDPGSIYAISSSIYPYVGNKHGVKAQNAERCIRHAIEVSYDRCDFDVLQGWFGSTVSKTKGIPTNSEFIARIANTIRREMV